MHLSIPAALRSLQILRRVNFSVRLGLLQLSGKQGDKLFASLEFPTAFYALMHLFSSLVSDISPCSHCGLERARSSVQCASIDVLYHPSVASSEGVMPNKNKMWYEARLYPECSFRRGCRLCETR